MPSCRGQGTFFTCQFCLSTTLGPENETRVARRGRKCSNHWNTSSVLFLLISTVVNSAHIKCPCDLCWSSAVCPLSKAVRPSGPPSPLTLSHPFKLSKPQTLESCSFWIWEPDHCRVPIRWGKSPLSSDVWLFTLSFQGLPPSPLTCFRCHSVLQLSNFPLDVGTMSGLSTDLWVDEWAISTSWLLVVCYTLT